MKSTNLTPVLVQGTEKLFIVFNQIKFILSPGITSDIMFQTNQFYEEITYMNSKISHVKVPSQIT